MTITYPIIKMTVGEDLLEFAGEEIIYATLTEEFNPIAVELPAATLEFSIANYDESFSMFSGATFQLLSERLPLLVYQSIDSVEYLLGKFYLDYWENVSETNFKFIALDAIGVLAATKYDGGFWSVATTLEDVLADLLNPLDMGYTLDPSITEVEISGWISPGDYRKALQQICFAAGAAVSTARSQTLDIIPVSLPLATYTHRIWDSEKSVSQNVKLTPLVASIELVSHNYTQSAVLDTIFEEYLEIGTYKIIFEKPYYDITVNGPGYTPALLGTEDGANEIVTEGGDYIEVGGEYIFGPNCLYLNLTAAGTVTVTGYSWLDSKRAFTFNEEDVEEHENKLTLEIADATMVNIDNAQTVLDLVRDYYRMRYKQHIKLLPSQIKTSDIVLNNAFYSRHILAKVIKMDMDLTSGFLAETDILGIEYPGVAPDPAIYLISGVNPTLEL